MLGSGDGSSFIIKLRGLPFSTNATDVITFLNGVSVVNGVEGVHLTETKPGRPSGQCYVEVETEEDVELALKKDKQHLGKRYIEVFTSDRQEMEWSLNHAFDGGSISNLDHSFGVVKLRGLPFGCSKDEIAQFFVGLEIVADGIMILSDHTGRSSGEAFVIFENKYDAQAALEMDREKIGHRYIEVFLSSPDDVRAYQDRQSEGTDFGRFGGGGYGGGRGGRPNPYDRPDRFGGGGRGPPRNNFRGNNRFRGGGGGGGGPLRGSGGSAGGDMEGHCVHMRGLPFKATASDIAFFFKPVRPSNVNILFDDNNRPSGEADVEFECHQDALWAMRKDKSHMEHRYIELFLNSSPGSRIGGGGGEGGGGGFNINTFRNY